MVLYQLELMLRFISLPRYVLFLLCLNLSVSQNVGAQLSVGSIVDSTIVATLQRETAGMSPAEKAELADELIQRGEQAGNQRLLAEGLMLKGQLALDRQEYSEALTWLAPAETLFVALQDDSRLAHTLSNIGLAYDYQGAWQQAMPYFERALALFSAAGDTKQIARSLVNIGVLHDLQGNYKDAITFYTRGKDTYASIDDTVGVAAALNNLGIVHRIQGKHEDALAYYAEALSLREAVGAFPDIATSLNNLGVIYDHLGKYAEALAYHQRSLAIKDSLNNKRGVASSLFNIANIQHKIGNYDEALQLFEQSLALDDTLGNKNGIASALHGIGSVWVARGNYEEGLKHLFRSLALKEEVNDRRGVASALNNIGNVYKAQGQTDDALEFYERSLQVNEAIANTSGIATAMNNIGSIYALKEDLDEALLYYLRGLSIRERLADQRGLVASLSNIGALYAQQENYTEAIGFYDRALAIGRSLGDRAGIANVLRQMGTAYLSLEQFDEALALTEEALFEAEAVGSLVQRRDIYKQKADILERQGQASRALEAYKTYVTLQDSLLTSDSQSIIAEYQEQYRTVQQRQQIEILEARQRNQELWLGALLAGLFLIGLATFLVANGYRSKQQAYAELDEAHIKLKSTQAQLIHQEKLASLGQLSTGIAHEIKNPLNFVNNFAALNLDLVEELRESWGNEEEVRFLLENLEGNTAQIAKHGSRADAVVKNMMHHAAGSSGNKVMTELNSLVKQLVAIAVHGLQTERPDTGIRINTTLAAEAIMVQVVPQDLGRVVQNVVLNAHEALMATHVQSPAIHIKTSRQNGHAIVQIEDNGPGIPEADQPRVFEPFFTTRADISKTGLGLSLSYDIITQGHGGTLSFESSDAGTVFTIQLPVVEA